MEKFKENVKKLNNYTKHLTKTERYNILSVYIDYLKLKNLGEKYERL